MRRFLLIIAMALPLVTIPSSGANAVQSPSTNVEGDVFTTYGQGTVEPALAYGYCDRQWAFSASAVDIGDEAGSYSVYYDANGTDCDTGSFGHGDGDLTISDPSAPYGYAQGDVAYTHSGSGLTLSGTIYFNQEMHYVQLNCTFTTTDTLEGDYVIACTGVWQLGLT
jgi:hypothetical protein